MGVELGDNEVVAAAVAGGSLAGGEGLIAGESNGSGVGMGPFLHGSKMFISGGGMDFWGGVEGSLMVLGFFGDEVVDWEGSGREDDYTSGSAAF